MTSKKWEKEKRKEYNRNYYRHYGLRLRIKAIKKLGAKCSWCGYDKDVRGLEVDHINGGAKKEITSGWVRQKFHRDISNGTRTDAQILCGTCHNIKTFKQLKYGIDLESELGGE